MVPWCMVERNIFFVKSEDIPLKLFHYNIRSLRKKCGEFDAFLVDKDYDFLCINEHWLVSAEVTSVLLQGYSPVSYFCRTEAVHGGVAIYCLDRHVRSVVSLEQICKLSIEFHCELAAVEGDSFLIISAYRTPDSDLDLFMEKLSVALQLLLNKGKWVFVAGDFNVHFNNREKKTVALINFFKSFGLLLTTLENTRGDRCLDNVFTNVPNTHFNNYIIDPYLSDHAGVCLRFKLPVKRKVSERIVYRPINDVGLYNLNHMLGQVTWDFVDYADLDVSTKFQMFVGVISVFIETAFPEKTKLITENVGKVKVNWFTEELRQERETLNFLNDIYKRHPSTPLWDQINRLRSQYRADISKAKKNSP